MRILRTFDWSFARTLLLSTLGVSLLLACGPSKEEFQAEIDKNRLLSAEYAQEREAHQRTQDELDDARLRVTELRKQLEQMGVNLDALSSQVHQEATEKARLTQSLQELQAALDEYKRRAEQLETIRSRYEALQQKLAKLVDMGLKVEIRHNRMVIRLPGDVLFASGSDKLRKEGESVVAAVAEVIRNDAQLQQRYFQIAGHTDDRPISSTAGRFGDNWGLSAMRAREVLLFLIKDPAQGGGGLDVLKLHAAGYGDTDPIASNTSPEGRLQNRRVELVLMPDVEEMLDLKKML